ncbi:hypothetical protein JCM10207_003334 [Rhodosporidiobolus poonsookiae]
MPTLASAPSFTSASTVDKKLEEGQGRVGPASTFSPLALIAEDEQDEGARIAGEVAQKFSEEEMEVVRKKIDRRVVPLLAAVYFSQFLDKNSINYSSVMGLPITGEHYNLVSLAFYVGYFFFEPVQSMLAQRFPLAKYLGVNILLWASALILHSSSGKWGVFFLWRFLLGTFECVVSPILIAMVASWYRKNEQSKRIGAFYVMNGVTNIIGGLLAWGITHYKGHSVAHWRIIYFVLGGMAFVVGAAVLIWLPDSPSTASFLTEREKQIALERVRSNQSGTISHRFKREQAIEALTDPKVWAATLLMAIICVPNAAVTTFTSIIIKSFGYTSQEALLLNMPCGAVAIITTITMSVCADKYNKRMLPLLGSVLPSIVGFALLLAYSNPGQYKAHKAPLFVGILLGQTFVSGIAMLYSWSASNIGGSTKKAVVNGLLLVAFSGANAAGTQAFASNTAPRYLPGKIALFVLLFCLVPGTLLLHFYVRRLNAKKAAEVARLVQENGWTDEDLQREKDRLAFADLTDKQNPFFTYIL